MISHISKMIEAGIILRFLPILSPDKIVRSTSALIYLHVEMPVIDSFAGKMSKLEQVRSIFHLTGEANILIRLFLPESRDLEGFIRSELTDTEGVKIVSSQIITQTVKDEPGAVLGEDFSVKLKCDYCGSEITSDAIVINVEQGKRFLCCTSCVQLYKSKYIEKKPVAQPFS